jgi:hypothetical protein
MTTLSGVSSSCVPIVSGAVSFDVDVDVDVDRCLCEGEMRG